MKLHKSLSTVDLIALSIRCSTLIERSRKQIDSIEECLKDTEKLINMIGKGDESLSYERAVEIESDLEFSRTQFLLMRRYHIAYMNEMTMIIKEINSRL